MFCVPGFFKVLAELTQTGDVTAEQFLSQSHCTHILKPYPTFGKINWLHLTFIVCVGIQKSLST